MNNLASIQDRWLQCFVMVSSIHINEWVCHNIYMCRCVNFHIKICISRFFFLFLKHFNICEDILPMISNNFATFGRNRLFLKMFLIDVNLLMWTFFGFEGKFLFMLCSVQILNCSMKPTFFAFNYQITLLLNVL